MTWRSTSDFKNIYIAFICIIKIYRKIMFKRTMKNILSVKIISLQTLHGSGGNEAGCAHVDIWKTGRQWSTVWRAKALASAQFHVASALGGAKSAPHPQIIPASPWDEVNKEQCLSHGSSAKQPAVYTAKRDRSYLECSCFLKMFKGRRHVWKIPWGKNQEHWLRNGCPQVVICLEQP